MGFIPYNELVTVAHKATVFAATFNRPPVAATRPRICRGRAYNDEKYSEYKAWLSQRIRQRFPHLVIKWPTNEKAKAALRKAELKKRYIISYTICIDKDTGDRDNYDKTICDAIEQAGIIANDKTIKFSSDCAVVHRPDLEPFVSIKLDEIEVYNVIE